VHDTTRLLERLAAGGQAPAELLPLVYGELHRLARRSMRSQASDHTLQPTALVHEAWLRLAAGGTPMSGREHFLAVAAKAMRSVLIDHARGRNAKKRDAGRRPEELDAAATEAPRSSRQLLALHEALGELAQIDPPLANLVELRFFGGLGIDELAAMTGVSPRTVKRNLRTARAWLRCTLDPGDDDAHL
jgi:RNA polymerase sigma-70 factor, ECF subfamily